MHYWNRFFFFFFFVFPWALIELKETGATGCTINSNFLHPSLYSLIFYIDLLYSSRYIERSVMHRVSGKWEIPRPKVRSAFCAFRWPMEPGNYCQFFELGAMGSVTTHCIKGTFFKPGKCKEKFFARHNRTDIRKINFPWRKPQVRAKF